MKFTKVLVNVLSQLRLYVCVMRHAALTNLYSVALYSATATMLLRLSLLHCTSTIISSPMSVCSFKHCLSLLLLVRPLSLRSVLWLADTAEVLLYCRETISIQRDC